MQDFLNPPGHGPVAIYEDGGGIVTKYQQMAAQYTLEKRRVEIHGSCRSACVLALSVPTVCVVPGAVVKAHQAYELYSKKVRPDVTNEMMRSLPVKIKATLESNLQTYYTPESTLTYSELRDLGIPDCNGQVAYAKPQKPTVSQDRPRSKDAPLLGPVKVLIVNPIQRILSLLPR